MNERSTDNYIKKIILLIPLLIIVGSIIGVTVLSFLNSPNLPIATYVESEKFDVPLENISTGTGEILLETQNHLLWSWFESLPPESYPAVSQLIGLLMWFLLMVFVVLITTLNRYAFLIGAGTLILLLSFSGVNALNIGGINTNYGLMICLFGLVLPAGVIHIFFDHWGFSKRLLTVFVSGIACFFALIYFSTSISPTLLFSENFSLLAMIITAGFSVYIGHAFISTLFTGLVALNQNIGIKISWHFSIFSTVYLVWIGLNFLVITGSISSIPLIPYQFLFILVGCLGYFEVNRKMQYISQPYDSPWTGRGLYLAGFGISLLVMFKADLTVNTPMADFMEHIFIYSQLGFGLLFYLYLMINFSPIINSGKAINQIMYKPPYFPYFHMRLGGLLTMLILLVYADGIIAIQFSTASTQTSADYYYSTSRPVEAGVLYDNAFERYRRNKKALNASAHLSLEQNQPTLALNTLTRSFNENPNPADILLLTGILKRSNKINDAIFYMEEGLKYFPNHSIMMNNLALFYHKINRADESMQYLEKMDSHQTAQLVNLTAIKTRYNIGQGVEEGAPDDLMARINRMAHLNRTGEKADFTLATDTIKNPDYPINRAMIRNQWTNAIDPLNTDQQFIVLDSLLANELMSLSNEEDIRESGLVLRYRAGHVNELLKQLNGMAFKFNRNAGYYHGFAAAVLTEQIDFKNAAIEWKQALEKGFSKFTPAHLPLLYFGGMENEAIFISGTYGVPFPSWMRFEENAKLVESDTIKYYRNLARLPEMLGSELFPALEEIQTPELCTDFVKALIFKKGHWLDDGELEYLKTLVPASDSGSLLKNYIEALKNKNLFDDLGVSNYGGGDGWYRRNAFLAPLILMGLDRLNSDEDRYSLLQEACQFNKDPLLWINLVKYSRIIGLDQYASSSLAMMSDWIGSEELIELQIEHL